MQCNQFSFVTHSRLQQFVYVSDVISKMFGKTTAVVSYSAVLDHHLGDTVSITGIG